MRQNPRTTARVLAILALSLPPAAAQEKGIAQVQIPLETYERLQAGVSRPADGPAGYALGEARVTVDVAGSEQRAAALVQVQLQVEVLEDRWVVIPVLPAGTAVESATVAGKPISLLFTKDGLSWSTGKAGSHAVSIAYRVEAARSETGFTLAVPLPRGPIVQLTASLPGVDLDVAVIPGTGVKTVSAGSTTQVSATVPTGGGVQISWRFPSRQRHSLSRAAYRGELVRDAVVWTAQLEVEMFGEGATLVPLLSRSTTLTALKVDGSDAPILADGKRLATLVRGRGPHRIALGFEAPVVREGGPPRVDLEVPQVPVSRFDLTLPGNKTLSVTPPSRASCRTTGPSTVATVYVPMTERVSLAWSEAVPGELAQLRASATVYHIVHAEEGVLYVRALVDFEVSRGETSLIELSAPRDVQIERVADASGVVADWRVGAEEGDRRSISVFLDRELSGALRFEVLYDRPLAGAEVANGIALPLLQVASAQRRRGMLALLADAELTFVPIEEGGATRVGENQLPEFVRETTKETVAHTFKYADTLPALVVQATVPLREQGKFDAQVDTLVSLGDVTLTGAASAEVQVKSGGVTELQLEIPPAVTILHLTAPSLRAYKVTSAPDAQIIDVSFTQEMEGTFGIELTYERILGGGDSQVQVPTLAVRGAEVEQGRIAVEALSAIEVRPVLAENLSPLDARELPRQLLLRTTNPILLAYRYVQAIPTHRLAIDVARHKVLEVQEAAIDRAEYRTLFTSDGLSVTTARLVVRNGRRQFLRVQLPKNSEVWSVFVDGKPEKPALAEPGATPGGAASVLIKIVNSSDGFPVEMVYATTGAPLGRRGSVDAALARPDVLVTHTRWDAYLPEAFSYGTPTTNMTLTEAAGAATVADMDAQLARVKDAAGARQSGQALRIVVPASGIHLALEKLYANQSNQEAWFRASYRRP